MGDCGYLDGGSERAADIDAPPPPPPSQTDPNTPTATQTEDDPASSTNTSVRSPTTSESDNYQTYPPSDSSMPASSLPGALNSSPTATHTPSSAQETAPTTANARKGFPLPAAAVIGAVLSFLVVSAIVWGLWFWLRRRRRARALPPDWDFAPPPKRMSGLSDSTYTMSTDVPHFISAAEVRQQSLNPFAHPADERERDPFGGPAKLRRGNTLGTVSTMSV